MLVKKRLRAYLCQPWWAFTEDQSGLQKPRTTWLQKNLKIRMYLKNQNDFLLDINSLAKETKH